eukprot:CAMPEP_0184715696 /NCGR_PEP_ID=MMETSP0314-20130426/5577_1 /TAXON_ID=38298 /ORGANISM="Rhodella maculata, Strain CCMP 736" /LENGTH=48 /DNA_ID= /DNA_START= /DNA_END= /DNA_ORIENTATION=
MTLGYRTGIQKKYEEKNFDVTNTARGFFKLEREQSAGEGEMGAQKQRG